MYGVFFMMVNFMVVVVGICGNIMVCIVVFMSICFCCSFNFFFFSLVIVDLVVMMICEFLVVVMVVKSVFFYDCVFSLEFVYVIGLNFLCFVLVMYLVVISVDCFFVVVYFFCYSWIMNSYGLKIMLGVVWGVFIIFVLCCIFFFKEMFYLVFVVFVVSYGLMIICYVIIVIFFVKEKWSKNEISVWFMVVVNFKIECCVVFMLVMVMVIFIVCWLLMIVVFFVVGKFFVKMYGIVYMWIWFLVFLNLVMNFIIYSVSICDFWDVYVLMCWKIFYCM